MRDFGLLLVLGVEVKKRKEEKGQRLGQILSFFSLCFEDDEETNPCQTLPRESGWRNPRP